MPKSLPVAILAHSGELVIPVKYVPTVKRFLKQKRIVLPVPIRKKKIKRTK
jgi:hypothetical protein